jgi:hypothetical protein
MKEYTTSDLGLIAALSLFYRHIDIDESDPRRILFIFEETPELLKIVDQHFSGELQVSSIVYFDKVKQIKNRLFNSNKGYLYR